uniref:Uncharacterized protein n=1 Tax=Ciona savignyi TaxID=51511 RepID=H2Z4J8_CIOSA
MNSQQYIQYQMAVSAGIQGIPSYAPPPAPFLPMPNPAALTGGMQVAIPPPPPPAVVSTAGASESALTTVSSSDEISDKEPASAVDTLEKKEENEVNGIPAALNSTTTTTSAIPGGAVVPTPVVLPSTSQPSLIGGVYAGAYFQQALPQAAAAAQMPVAQPQYMMAQAGVQYAVPQSSKLMYVPQGYGGIPPSPYVAGGQQQMLVQDHTGKMYIVNNPAPVQYQVAQPA